MSNIQSVNLTGINRVLVDNFPGSTDLILTQNSTIQPAAGTIAVSLYTNTDRDVIVRNLSVFIQGNVGVPVLTAVTAYITPSGTGLSSMVPCNLSAVIVNTTNAQYNSSTDIYLPAGKTLSITAYGTALVALYGQAIIDLY